MKFNLPVFASRLHEERRVECDGFYDGAHGTSHEVGLEEIDARFEEKKAALQKDTVERQKRLEASIQHFSEIGPELERMWTSVCERNRDDLPNVVLPVVIICLGALALIAEALLLAPGMDILNVTEPTAQMFTAFGLSSATALAFHFAWESFTSEALPGIWKLTYRVVALLLAAGLVAWGILRGLQVGFAAKISENPLSDFLAGHPILSSIFYVFVTLATPIMAATASHFGAHALQQWWEWKSIKHKAQSLSKRRSEASKQLEKEDKALALGLKGLDEERKQWRAAYALHHARGSEHGSKQEPYWTVPAKATFAALLALFLMGWFIFFVSPFFFLLPVIVWWAAYWHYRRQWRSPSRNEFFDLEHVQFAIAADDRAHGEQLIRAFRHSGARQ